MPGGKPPGKAAAIAAAFPIYSNNCKNQLRTIWHKHEKASKTASRKDVANVACEAATTASPALIIQNFHVK